MVEAEPPDLTHQISCTTTTLVKYSFPTNPKAGSSSSSSTRFMTTGNAPNGLDTTTTTKTKFNFSLPSGGSGGGCCGNGRPPFITTVTRGRFLPSKFDLLVERSLYTFSSKPRAVGPLPKCQNCCSSSATKSELSSPPRGVHDYYNVMWDPHVVRGTTAATTRYADPNDLSTKPQEADAAREPKIKKKRSTNIFRTRFKPAESFSLGRKSRYTPSPIEGRLHNIAQTEKQFLEELIRDTEESSDATVQTDLIYDMPILPSSQPEVTIKTGIDAWTQVLPGELFDFETEVVPMLESFVGKLLEQAMFEVIEEEEISALREQKNRFQETRRLEEMELRQLQEQQRKLNAEKERIKLELEQGNFLAGESQGQQRGESVLSRLGSSGTSTYTTSYLLELLPSVLSSLRQEGFLADTMIDGDDEYPSYIEAEPEPGPDTENIPTSGSPTTETEEGLKTTVDMDEVRVSEAAGSLDEASESEHDTTISRIESWNASQ